MDPPSYDEARLQPPSHGGQILNYPPSYNASAATPPPAYGDAVSPQANPYPILNPPSVPTAAAPHHHNGVTVYPITQIGVPQTARGRSSQPAVIVNQPPPVAVAPANLRDAPALVRCPHCHHQVTTKVKYKPGDTAWCLCVLIACVGLICGFCLIPLLLHKMQDAHHSCPQCGKPVHVFKR